MSATLANLVPTKKDQSLNGPRRYAVKATLQTAATTNEDEVLVTLSRCVKDALIQAHGSGQAASITLSMNQSNMNRKIALGTIDLRELAAGGPQALARLGELLLDVFGDARQTPEERMAALLADAQQRLNEASQLALRLESRR